MDEEEGRVSLGAHSRSSALLGGWTFCLVESPIGEKDDLRCDLQAGDRISRPAPNILSESQGCQALSLNRRGSLFGNVTPLVRMATYHVLSAD